MGKKIIFTPSVLALSFLLCSVSYPQIRETGTIQGNIVDDEKNALPGVAVTIEGEKLMGGPRSVIANARGFYRFPSLLPGEYQVKAALEGFDIVVKKGIRLHANITLSVDFILPLAKITQAVIVEAAASMIDLKSSSTGGVIITHELLTSLPMNREKFWDVIDLAPGIVDNMSYGSGRGYGMGPVPNSWQIDGVEMRNPTSGGIWNLKADLNIIEEINVDSLGLSAEYGEFTGSVVTATTKSGGNNLSLFEEIRYNGTNWVSDNRNKIPAEEWFDPFTLTLQKFVDEVLAVGSQVGYRIIKDKIWFFLSGEYKTVKQTTSQATGAVDKSKDYQGFMKLTYQLNPSNKLNGSLIFMDSRQVGQGGGRGGGGGPLMDPEIGVVMTRPGYYLNLNWTSVFSPTSFLELKIGYNENRNINEPIKGRDIPGHEDLYLNINTENVTQFTEYYQKSYQWRTHYSKYFSDFFGAHSFKFGGELTYNKTFQSIGYPGGEKYEDYNHLPYRRYVKSPIKQDYHSRTIVGFVEDSWNVSKRLTLNLGLRYNNYQYKIPAPDRGVIYEAQSFSPRIGLSFDLFGNRKNVLKLHYGRYYETLADSFFSGLETRYFDEDVYEWDGNTGEYILVFTKSNSPTTRYEINPDLKQPYIDEITASFERELFRNASLRISLYYRTLGRAIGAVDIGTEWRPISITNPGLDGIVGTADDRGTFEGYDKQELGQQYFYITNPQKGDSPGMIDDPKRDVKGFEIVFTKRYSNRWQLTASYNYGIAKGNAGGTLFSPLSPNELITPYGETRLGLNYPQPNMFKLHGTVLLPLDINLGIMLSWMSGHPAFASFVYQLPVSGSYAFTGGYMGEFSTESGMLFSIRLEKIFDVFGGKLSYALDANNVFNTCHPVGRSFGFGPNFLKVTSAAASRVFRVSFRFIF